MIRSSRVQSEEDVGETTQGEEMLLSSFTDRDAFLVKVLHTK